MEKFMLLFKGGRKMTPEESKAAMPAWMSWMEGLKKSGQYHEGYPLKGPGKTVTSPDEVSDYVSADNPENVGGYIIISAESLDAATDIAKSSPSFKAGGGFVEVKEIMKM